MYYEQTNTLKQQGYLVAIHEAILLHDVDLIQRHGKFSPGHVANRAILLDNNTTSATSHLYTYHQRVRELQQCLTAMVLPRSGL